MILKMKKEKTKPKEENILEENSSDNKNDIVENEEKSTIDEQILEREMRKHISWYMKGIKGAAELRGKINQVISYNEMEQLLKNEILKK